MIRINSFAWSHHKVPPAGTCIGRVVLITPCNMGVTGKGVTDEDSIVSLLIQLTNGFIGYGDRAQAQTTVQYLGSI